MLYKTQWPQALYKYLFFYSIDSKKQVVKESFEHGNIADLENGLFIRYYDN